MNWRSVGNMALHNSNGWTSTSPGLRTLGLPNQKKHYRTAKYIIETAPAHRKRSFGAVFGRVRQETALIDGDAHATPARGAAVWGGVVAEHARRSDWTCNRRSAAAGRANRPSHKLRPHKSSSTRLRRACRRHGGATASAAFAVYQGSTPWDFNTTWERVDGLPELIIVLGA